MRKELRDKGLAQLAQLAQDARERAAKGVGPKNGVKANAPSMARLARGREEYGIPDPVQVGSDSYRSALDQYLSDLDDWRPLNQSDLPLVPPFPERPQRPVAWAAWWQAVEGIRR